ncbi:MAG: uroporphyrinogen-III C-methyltransferase [Planctomycetota bacterium]
MTVRGGSVYLIGAGPGDIGMITVRGMEVLRRVDVVIYDNLIASGLLDEARADAELIDASKKPHDHTLDQRSIEAVMLDRAEAGLSVARLKGGDPFVFGRGFEELEACAARDIPCEVIPGVSSALAGPAAGNIPVTLRGVARGFAVVTGHSRDDDPITREDLAPYANAETLVLLMGVRALPTIVAHLRALGRAADTPVAVVERAWMPGQRQISGTLETIADAARTHALRSPAVIIVGDVSRAPERLASLNRPLAQQRIVVTRPDAAAGELCDHLRRLGADVVHAPLIEIQHIEPDADWTTHLSQADWLVFSSRQGARGFTKALRRAGLDARAFPQALIAAVGPTTARELEASGLHVDLIPPVYRAASLIDVMAQHVQPGQRVVYPRGTLARHELPDGLRAAGFVVDSFDVYRTELLEPDNRAREAIEAGVDAVLFASPSAVTAYVDAALPATCSSFVCIGPTTGRRAIDAGLTPVTIADTHTDAGLIDALLHASAEVTA